MWNPKIQNKTKVDSQNPRTKLLLPKGRERGGWMKGEGELKMLGRETHVAFKWHVQRIRESVKKKVAELYY